MTTNPTSQPRTIGQLPAFISKQIGSVLSVLVSFEFVFVLYLFSGQFKTDPRLGWVPFDLSLALALLSLMYGGFEILRLRLRPTRLQVVSMALGATFVAWGILSSLWSPAFSVGGPIEAYARNKLLSFGAFGLWAFGAGSLIIASSPQRINRFGISLALFSIPYCIGTLTYQRENYWDSVMVFGSNYLGVGRVLGAGLVAFLYYLFFRVGSIPGQTILLLGALAYLFALITSGVRGPLVASAVCFVALFIASVRSSAHWKLPLIVAILAAGAFPFLVNLVPSTELRSLNRFQYAIEGQDKGSVDKRVELLDDSLRLVRESSTIVAGSGLGSWPALVNQTENYPHNIFMEVLVELGIVGFGLLIALMLLALRCFWFSSLPERHLWLALTVYFLVNQMVSGDLHSSSKNLLCALAMAPALLTHAQGLRSKR